MSKITGNEPAAPIKYEDARIDYDGTNIKAKVSYGLTIRQHFAAMMMASYNSNESTWNKDTLDKAKWACEDADALIAELNKENV